MKVAFIIAIVLITFIVAMESTHPPAKHPITEYMP
jgi:hypothetical protein